MTEQTATDERGLLPRNIKRGVLSEDGLYNVLTEAWEERRAHSCGGKQG